MGEKSSQIGVHESLNATTEGNLDFNQEEHMAIYGVNTGSCLLARIRIPPQAKFSTFGD